MTNQLYKLKSSKHISLHPYFFRLSFIYIYIYKDLNSRLKIILILNKVDNNYLKKPTSRFGRISIQNTFQINFVIAKKELFEI